MTGTLYIISAPSGAGKSSLINAYLKQKDHLPLIPSISHTTRSPRPGEIDGKEYYFTSKDHFLSMIQEDAFIEYAQVFGNYYGSSKAAIEMPLAEGYNLFLDVDWQGAQQVRERMPQSVSIFILPPSLDALHERLIHRGQDDDATIQKRMAEAQDQIAHYTEYDYVIVNDQFDRALADLSAILHAESLRTDKRDHPFSS